MVPRFYSASRSTARLVANVSEDEAPTVPSGLVSRLTKNSTRNSAARGALAQQREKKFKNLPENVKLTQRQIYEECLRGTILRD